MTLNRWSNPRGAGALLVLVSGGVGLQAAASDDVKAPPTHNETERGDAYIAAPRDLQPKTPAPIIVRNGFTSVGSTQGLKACDQLADEYEQLQPVMAHRGEGDPLSISHLPILAGETYRRGLHVLSDALELLKAANTPERERLLSEMAELEPDVEA